MRRLSLPIALDRPCDADWSAMQPCDRDRCCSACERTVHDLSAMSAEESRAALDRGGEICVRYLFDASGRVLHRGDEVGDRTLITMRDRRNHGWLAAAGVALASVVLEACGGARMPREDLIHAPMQAEDELGMDAGVADGEPTTEGGESR